jgi:hypothetical protein
MPRSVLQTPFCIPGHAGCDDEKPQRASRGMRRAHRGSGWGIWGDAAGGLRLVPDDIEGADEVRELFLGLAPLIEHLLTYLEEQ